MTTLPDRPNSALLVVDVQVGAVTRAHDRDRVITNIGTVVEKARLAGVPVLWVQHSDDQLPLGGDSWRYVPELVRRDGEPVVHKRYGDSFEGTDLETLLAGRRVGHLVVTGVQTDMCIRSTLHGAFVRGYDVTLVGDAHTTEDLTGRGAPPPELVIAHTNLCWHEQRAPGRRGRTMAAAQVTFTMD
ncbi:isochorismatase family protein [Phytohabitans suffuscus]|uniref:Isochorismatase n=1 Tax=Phytohabitans suffuscus TaxID=624315 RepID=A0A6F8Y9X4_9ACTN|nr:isochorismatase family protein [Phytohabitans suffuscus]BCB82906.1 isochorismatase [Phytohabitans suffuscus]